MVRATPQTSPRLIRLARACAAAAAGLGVLALLGWTRGLPALSSFASDLIPMAPSTAGLFLLLGTLAAFQAATPQRAAAHRISVALGCAGTLLSLLLLVLSSLGIHPAAEHLGMTIAGTVSGAPIGHISPVTAFCFVIAGASLVLLSGADSGRPRWIVSAFVSASLVLCIGVILVVAYLLGGPLLYGSRVIPPALSTTLAFLLLATALLIASGLRAWPRRQRSDPAVMRATYVLVLAFALLAAGIVAVSYVRFHHYQRRFQADMEATLEAIAELKVGELTQWRRERLGDALWFVDNDDFSRRVRSWLENPADARARAGLESWLQHTRAAFRYDRVCLLDAAGVERACVPAATEPAEPHLLADALEVLRTRRPTLLDFHREDPGGAIHLAVLAPILDQGQALGVLVLRIDPRQYLYPMLRRWPTSSRTGEALLVRREGEEVVFLNDLRFRANAALNLRIPLTQRDNPAARAVQGEEGVMQGPDDRGQPALAAARAVPGSPWVLLARMDAAEVYAPLRRQLGSMLATIAALLLGAGALVGLVWRNQRVRFYRQEFLSEQALRESQHRFYSTLNGMLEGFQIIGHDWRYLYLNDAAAAFGRRAKGELLGRTLMECYPGIQETPMFAALQRCMQERVPLRVEEPFTYPDGASAWFELSIQPVPEGVVVLSLDTTQRKHAEAARENLEAQLLQAQKMEAVGRLAGGVAHDFNNMLQTILGYADLLLVEIAPGHPQRESVEEIEKAAQRSADLTGQLLAFARKQTIAPRVLDLNESVAGLLKMLRRLIGEDIDLLWKPARDPVRVKMDPAQLHQILANLVVNARHAITGVGHITIETGAVEFDPGYCADHAGFVPGRYALLAVSDDGAGMDRETLANIFEPFFTTKQQGQGTGLGLATVYGIVKQNGGFINVYSEPGRGSTFKIYLALHGETAAEEAKPAAVAAPTGSETVLLVEDEAPLLKLSRRMLERLGYTVLAAGSAREAIGIAQARAGDIHLLMTDVVMPEMSGRDLWQRLLQLRPDLPCLFMSGYTANVITHHGVLDAGMHFLQKPFTSEALAAKLRQALEA